MNILRTLIITFGVICIAGCSPTEDPVVLAPDSVVDKELGFSGDQADPAKFVVGISHLNVVVEDIEYATEFYQRTMGFEQAYNARGIMDYPSVTRETFARDAGFLDGIVDVHIRFLKHPTAGIYIELMTYRFPVGSSEVVYRNTNDMGGIRHVAMEVSNAEKVFYYLKEQPDVKLINDSPDYGPPEELTPVTITFFYWLDPWGVQWEMEEGRPVGSVRGITG